MDIQPITITPLTIVPTPTPVTTTTFQDVAASLPVTTPDPTPAFEVTLPPIVAADVVDTTDLLADDILAQAELAQQAQETILSAMKAGATDVSLLASGLPPGATAMLLGGGWVRVPPGQDPTATEAMWSFHFPFRRENVPAVTSSTHTEPTKDNAKNATGGETPLTGYGPQGEKEAVPGETFPTTLDILD